jgi:hypothetical protein
MVVHVSELCCGDDRKDGDIQQVAACDKRAQRSVKILGKSFVDRELLWHLVRHTV